MPHDFLKKARFFQNMFSGPWARLACEGVRVLWLGLSFDGDDLQLFCWEREGVVLASIHILVLKKGRPGG